MSTSKKTHPKKNPSEESPSGRHGRALGLLALAGALAALWALFLWTELVRSRNGGTPLCGFSTDGDCGALWDAGFASTIHGLSGMPVAGWGLVWGLVAFLLPVLALAALADGRDAERILGAVRWTAAAGLVGLVVLLGASAAEGMFCTSCALTYVLTILYGGLAFVVLKTGPPLLGNGWDTAATAVILSYVLLLYPGIKTPKSAAGGEEQRVLAAAAESAARKATTSGGNGAAADGAGTATSSEAELDIQLRDFLGSLDARYLQALSDSLGIYRNSHRHEQRPRDGFGPRDAPVRITDFTDALCSHCATLHGTLSYMRNTFAADLMSLDSRHFPLDGNCNDKLTKRGPESVRCLAARAQICFEGSPHGFEFSGKIFENQSGLTEDDVYRLAAPYMERGALEACVKSSDTAQKLTADVNYAWNFEPRGTPLVLINGREGTSFGPFLYAMVLAGGNADHPLFADLPAPNPPDDHSGHDH